MQLLIGRPSDVFPCSCFIPTDYPYFFYMIRPQLKKILKCTRKPEACDVTARTQHFRYDLFLHK